MLAHPVAVARDVEDVAMLQQPVGATALVHGMTVVTRNVDDFAAMGVPLLNPWEYSAARNPE